MFLDLEMIGAESFVAWVRSDPRFAGLPLIALAGHPSESAFVRGHAVGADDVALRTDAGSITRRLAALEEAERASAAAASRG